jgi:hypothetical protein
VSELGRSAMKVYLSILLLFWVSHLSIDAKTFYKWTPDADTSLTEASKIEGFYVETLYLDSDLPSYYIEIEKNSSFLSRSSEWNAELVVIDKNGKEIATAPLRGFESGLKTSKRSGLYYGIGFSISKDYISNSYLVFSWGGKVRFQSFKMTLK